MSQGVDAFGILNNTIKVASGHYVDLLNPDPATIDIRSIAAALSKICRFGGHCPKFYSVAEHCIHAASIAWNNFSDSKAVLAVLLHDSAEAYIGDMVKPLKVAIPKYQKIEKKIERAIEVAFDINFDQHRDVIKTCDRAMLKAEKTTLWPEDKEVWSGFETIANVDVDFGFYRPREAERMFIQMARSLEPSILRRNSQS